MRTLQGVTSMFRAAQLVGEAVQIATKTVGAALATINMSSSVSLLLGGRIGDQPPGLYLIYNAGNFIECKPDVPFLQIGETKYGKPILDRGLDFQTPLARSGEVRLPLVRQRDALQPWRRAPARPAGDAPRPAPAACSPGGSSVDDEYFDSLSLSWAKYLHEATSDIPNPPWMPGREAAE